MSDAFRPQMDLSTLDPEVVARAQARACQEKLSELRERYDELNREASSLLEAIGYVSSDRDISVEQAVRDAEQRRTLSRLQ
jgi:hypothetical protein